MKISAPDWVQTLGALLDGVETALCLIDHDGRTLAWNRSFLKLFPEHDGYLYAGESYQANLRRFYTARLGPDELPHIDSYIDAGVARHHAQAQPYVFEHWGRRIQVASLPFGDLGRLRIWRADHLPAGIDAPEPLNLSSAPGTPPPAGTLLLDRVPDGLMICGKDGCIEWVNEPFVLMYDLPERNVALGITMQTVYQSVWAKAGEADSPLCVAGLTTLADNLRFCGAPFELALPGERFMRVIARPADGRSTFFAHVDISELKRQQRLLAQAERVARQSEATLRHKSALLLAMLENMEQGVAMLGSDGALEMYNRRAAELLRLPLPRSGERPGLAGTNAYMAAQEAFAHALSMLKIEPTPVAPAKSVDSLQSRCPDGRMIEVRTVPIEGGGFLRTFSDITEHHHEEQRMRYAANHDSLTGLLNRSMFMTCLSGETAIARRSGDGCAVLYLDLDGFKPINDQHGHAVGDRALVWVAQCILRIARESDLVARLGGDEFAVLQKAVTDPAQALALGERLLTAISESFMVETLQLHMGVSIGVSCCPLHADQPELLLNCADQAMYSAKAAGRHSVRLFQPQ